MNKYIRAILYGNGNDTSDGKNELVTTTITDSDANFSDSITIPELIGAKYFILQGNKIDANSSLSWMDDSGIIHSLIYIDGKIFVNIVTLISTKSCGISCGLDISDSVLFDESTGNITLLNHIGFLARLSVDVTEDVVYTVYRLG